jgi:hypothetical protein
MGDLYNITTSSKALMIVAIEAVAPPPWWQGRGPQLMTRSLAALQL